MIHGCFFHLRKSLYRKIQSLNLQKKYGTDPKFCHEIKMFSALAFVPTSDVDQAFEDLKNYVSFDNSEIAFVRYFEKTYVGTGSRKPMFDKELWNVRYAIDNNIPKTTNHVEGFHNRLKHAMKHLSHPPLGVMIDALKDEYMIYDFQKVQNDMASQQPLENNEKSKIIEIMKNLEIFPSLLPTVGSSSFLVKVGNIFDI